MEANPYVAPTAAMEDVAAWDALDLENRSASRAKRLGAVWPIFGKKRRCLHDLIADTIVVHA